MTLFTDNPFEKMMIQKPNGRRDNAPPVPYPPACASCPYKGQSPCVGYCLKQVQEKKNNRAGTLKGGTYHLILVIAEKPSVAQTIAAVLGAKEKKDGFLTGSGYIVSWCVGHLVGLAEAAAYGEQYKKWSYDSLPILPQEWKYTVASDKEKQFKTLKELMHRADVSEVVNACDAGREGELIFRFVYEMAGLQETYAPPCGFLLWRTAAIKEGFSRLKNGEEYDALFASALCRAKADWLIGINATRLFSVLYNHTLNVGRVQTPTLKMLVDRDAAITTFKKEKYYHVRLVLIRRGSCKRKTI